MKRIPAIILALALALCACSVQEGKPIVTAVPSPSTAPSEEPTAAPTPAADLYETVMTIGGDQVSYAELSYQIASLISSYEYFGEGAVDWEEEIDGVPAGEFFVSEAIDTCKLFRAIEKYADDYGYALTDERLTELDEELADYIEESGGEDAFAATLAEAGMTREFYEYLLYVPELYYTIYDSIYGEGGEREIADADVDAYFADNYLTTRHILKVTMDDEGNDLPADKSAEVEREVDELMEELRSGGDFAEAAKQHSDDDTLGSEAITFELSTMPEEYVAVAQALAPGEISDPVDIGGAYVIIMREELDSSYLSDNREALREEYGLELFRQVLDPVRDGLAVEKTAAFERVDVQTIYDFFFAS